MKHPKYLSPSAINLFLTNKDEYYLRYLSNRERVYEPQTQPMAIGSAFDAYVKAYLYKALMGTGPLATNNNSKYEFEALFEAQVDSNLRDWAREHGAYVMECYKNSGALADLLTEMENGSGARFEFEVMGAVHGYREGVIGNFPSAGKLESVVLLGKPDAHFVNNQGLSIVLDFKVNGYCSNRAISPAKGYVRLRASGGTNYGSHKEAIIHDFKGFPINRALFLEDVNKDWARQLSIYAWLLGESVGATYVTAIHQIVCNPNLFGLPSLRVAEHNLIVSAEYQKKLFNQVAEIWDIVQSDHFFRDLSLEESLELCEQLEQRESDPFGLEPDASTIKQR